MRFLSHTKKGDPAFNSGITVTKRRGLAVDEGEKSSEQKGRVRDLRRLQYRVGAFC